jgi:uncharacterized protein YfaS (alpha-2-macroglobulin family)
LAALAPLHFLQAAPTSTKGRTAEKTAEAKPAAPLEATLKIEPPDLSPGSTIELIFPTPMIDKERIGAKETESPLVIKPNLAGIFEWISTRSGHYRLSDPPKFNTSYDFALRPGLRDLAGKALSTEQLASARSAGFRLVDQHPRWFYGDDARRQMRFFFQFNDNVTPESAGAAITFVTNDPPKTVAAKTRYATGEDFERLYGDIQQTWEEQVAGITPSLTKDAVRRSALVVEPESPLPVGRNWRMVVATTLTNASGQDKLVEGANIGLGDVRPFQATHITAHTPFDQPYYLRVQFNKSLVPDADKEWTQQELAVIAQKVMTAVIVTPAPADVQAEVSGHQLIVRGPFELEREYQVTVQPALTSGDGLPLTAGLDTKVKFIANPPYVAAPAFIRAQLASGSGDFEFTAANVREVRVRVKRMNGSELLQAAHKYEGYQSSYYTEEDKRRDFKPAAFDEYSGDEIYERTITIDKGLDKSELIKLNWREILKDAPAAPLFVEFEGRAAKGLPHKGVVTQTLVQFTDLGLMQKSNGRETMVFVSSLRSGTPVAGARLTMVDEAHRLIGYADTDANGIAVIRGSDPGLVLAEKNGDCAVLRCLDSDYDSFVPYDIRRAWEPVWKPRRQTFVFSDRNLYRPGDTAHVKAHTRLRSGDDLRLDRDPVQAEMIVRDPRYRIIQQRTVTFTANGSLAEDLALPEGPLGWYNLSLKFPEKEGAADEEEEFEERDASYSFRIDDYRPNTFEVKIDPAKLELLADRMKLPVSANYFMGKSLSQAKVAWHAHSLQGFTPPAGFEDYHFGDAPYWAHYAKDRDSRGRYEHGESDGDGEWWVNGSVTLGEDGSAILEMPLPPPDRASLPQQVTVGADVTDINQQTVAATAQFDVPGAQFILGLRGPQFFGTAGREMPLEIVAIDPKGKPGPAGVRVDVKVERQEYHTLKIATAGGGTTTKDQVILREELKQTVDLAAPGQTPPSARIPFKPSRGGSYFLTAEATDAQGKKILSRLPLYVIGGGEFPWAMEDGARINLQPEKKTLKPGEEAVIVVKTPIAGNALVTVERNRIHSHFITPVSPDQPVIRVPIQDAEAPNVFVSVIVIRGSEASPKASKMPEYKVGYCELKVDSKLKELQVAIAPEREEVRPAEDLKVAATVTDHQAKPVPGAEVTLFAVDEGVLSLMAFKTPDPSGFFHAPMPLAIDNFTSFGDLLPEEAAARERGNKGFVIGGGGDENEAPLQVRKNFVATPLWLATAVSDEQGRISATVKTPDNLTRYRLMAVAVHGADRFGSGESAFKVNKPLMVEPVVPRFARLQDEVLLKAVLHNTTPHSGEVEVSLELDDKASFIREERMFIPASLKPPAADDAKVWKHTVQLQAGATTAVPFPVRFEKLGAAKWRWVARTTRWPDGAPALNDAAESTFEVNHPLPELREVRYARLNGGKPPANLAAEMNPALLEGEGNLHLSLSTSRLYEAKDALDYVLQYPYGCVEQTSSSTMPWLALAGYQSLFPDQLDAGRTKAAIQRGVDRLLRMRTEEGGLAYWPGGDEPSLWGSAYGGLVLLRARDAGAAVPADVIDKLLAYLSKELRGLDQEDDRYRMSDCALALYTLAKGKKPEEAYQNMLFARRDRLPESARLYTALAMCLTQTPHAQIKDMLGWKPPASPAKDKGAKKSDKPAPAPVISDDWDHWAGSGPNRALRLIAYTHLGLTEDADKLAQAIFDRRNGLGEWGNTYANAWILTGLAAYERSLKRSGEPLMAQVVWGALKTPLELPAPTTSARASFALDEKLAAAPLHLEIPENRLAFSRIEASAYPPTREFAGENKGYGIERVYEKMLADGSTTEAKDLRVGDMVVVKLTIDINGGDRYLAINDPLPSVLEPINPDFATQAANVREDVTPWFCDHRELRADRALFFTNYAPDRGRYALRYLTRVIAEGDTIAPPAKIEAMYQPDKHGLSPTHRLRTLPSAAGQVAGN